MSVPCFKHKSYGIVRPVIIVKMNTFKKLWMGLATVAVALLFGFFSLSGKAGAASNPPTKIVAAQTTYKASWVDRSDILVTATKSGKTTSIKLTDNSWGDGNWDYQGTISSLPGAECGTYEINGFGNAIVGMTSQGDRGNWDVMNDSATNSDSVGNLNIRLVDANGICQNPVNNQKIFITQPVNAGMSFKATASDTIKIIDKAQNLTFSNPRLQSDGTVRYYLDGQQGDNCQQIIEVNFNNKAIDNGNFPAHQMEYFEQKTDGTYASPISSGCFLTNRASNPPQHTDGQDADTISDYAYPLASFSTLKKPAKTQGGNGDSSNGSGNTNQVNDGCFGVNTNLNWILCPIVAGLSTAANNINTFVQGQLNIDVPSNFGQQIITVTNKDGSTSTVKTYDKSSIKTAWAVFKDLTSILLVLLMLVMVISQAMGSQMFDAYTVKKVMPKLVIAVIGMQLSWDICIWVIGLFNDIGNGVADLISAPFGGQSALDLPSLMNRLSYAWQAVSTAGSWIAIILAGMALWWWWPWLLIGGFLVFLAVIIAMATLLVRNAILIIGVIVAPIALLSWILPNTNKFWKYWYSNFSKALMLFPLVMGIIYGGRIFAWVAGDLGNPGPLDLFMVFIGYFGPYFFLPKTFKYGGTILAQASRAIGENGAIKGFRKKGIEIGKDINDQWKGKRTRSGPFRYNPNDKDKLRMKVRRLGYERDAEGNRKTRLPRFRSHEEFEKSRLDELEEAGVAIDKDEKGNRVARFDKKTGKYLDVFNQPVGTNSARTHALHMAALRSAGVAFEAATEGGRLTPKTNEDGKYIDENNRVVSQAKIDAELARDPASRLHLAALMAAGVHFTKSKVDGTLRPKTNLAGKFVDNNGNVIDQANIDAILANISNPGKPLDIAELKSSIPAVPMFEGRVIGRITSGKLMPTARGRAQAIQVGQKWADDMTQLAEIHQHRKLQEAIENGYEGDKRVPIMEDKKDKKTGKVVIDKRTGQPVKEQARNSDGTLQWDWIPKYKWEKGVAAGKQALVDSVGSDSMEGREAKIALDELFKTKSWPEIENSVISDPKSKHRGKYVWQVPEIWEARIADNPEWYPMVQANEYDLTPDVLQLVYKNNFDAGKRGRRVGSRLSDGDRIVYSWMKRMKAGAIAGQKDGMFRRAAESILLEYGPNAINDDISVALGQRLLEMASMGSSGADLLIQMDAGQVKDAVNRVLEHLKIDGLGDANGRITLDTFKDLNHRFGKEGGPDPEAVKAEFPKAHVVGASGVGADADKDDEPEDGGGQTAKPKPSKPEDGSGGSVGYQSRPGMIGWQASTDREVFPEPSSPIAQTPAGTLGEEFVLKHAEETRKTAESNQAMAIEMRKAAEALRDATKHAQASTGRPTEGPTHNEGNN